MKVRTIVRTVVFLVIVALLLVGSVALAQSSGPPPPVQYVVVQGVASGGHYRLASQAWQAIGISSGGGYRLAAPLGPTGTGTPCCCTYLPCLLRNYH